MQWLKDTFGWQWIGAFIWLVVWVACSVLAVWWALSDHLAAARERRAVARWILNRRSKGE